jgi:hypothetical protein
MRRLFSVAATLAFLFIVSTPRPAAASWDFEEVLEKYRERFLTGGWGQVGTVKVQARMLYGKDGMTRLEVTTGEFDSDATPTGLFLRLKVSALNAAGKEMYSFYYYPLGESSYQKNLQGLFPGQSFSIEAYAFPDWRTILFTSRIKIRTLVQKRPDLYAQRIDAPFRLPVGLPVQIVGVVSELNGQIGAHGDCVLYADGVEVDRTPKIWVDSGDTVSCAFSPTLNTAGLVTLRLAAESVKPADWDTANNIVERQVQVLELTPSFDGAGVGAVAVDVDNTTFNQVGRFLNTPPTSGYDWAYQESVNRNSDGFVYAGVAAAIPETPSSIMVTATDGVATWTLDHAVPNCNHYTTGHTNGRTFYTYVTGCGSLFVEVGSFAGTVTYASTLLVRTFQGAGPNVVYDGPAQVIYNNFTAEVEDGENLFHGDVWTIDVHVAAGPYVFNTPVTVILDQPFESGETVPQVCTTTSNTFTCNSSSWRLAGRTGSASVTAPLP